MPAPADPVLFSTVYSPHRHCQILSDGLRLTRTWAVVDIWNKGMNFSASQPRQESILSTDTT